MEKDQLFGEGAHYEDAFSNQNGGQKYGNQIQARKLGSNLRTNDLSNQQYNQSGPTVDANGALGSERESLAPQTLSNGAIYTGQWLNQMKDGYGQ